MSERLLQRYSLPSAWSRRAELGEAVSMVTIHARYGRMEVMEQWRGRIGGEERQRERKREKAEMGER